MTPLLFLLPGERTFFDDQTIHPMTIRQMLSSYGKMKEKNSSRLFRVSRGVIFGRELTISCLMGKFVLSISSVIRIVQSPSMDHNDRFDKIFPTSYRWILWHKYFLSNRPKYEYRRYIEDDRGQPDMVNL